MIGRGSPASCSGAIKPAYRAIPVDVIAATLAHDASQNTEVSDEGVCARPENVRRLDVAMNDALLVRVCKRINDIVQNSHRVANRQRSFSVHRGLQRLTHDERHCVIEELAVFSRGQERHYVRMLELRGHLNLAPEPSPIYLGRKLRRKELSPLAADRPVGRHEHSEHPLHELAPICKHGKWSP